ncbi:MAG: hypothetical protein EZS28_031733, partial [Streblomastix strix]
IKEEDEIKEKERIKQEIEDQKRKEKEEKERAEQEDNEDDEQNANQKSGAAVQSGLTGTATVGGQSKQDSQIKPVTKSIGKDKTKNKEIEEELARQAEIEAAERLQKEKEAKEIEEQNEREKNKYKRRIKAPTAQEVLDGLLIGIEEGDSLRDNLIDLPGESRLTFGPNATTVVRYSAIAGYGQNSNVSSSSSSNSANTTSDVGFSFPYISVQPNQIKTSNNNSNTNTNDTDSDPSDSYANKPLPPANVYVFTHDNNGRVSQHTLTSLASVQAAAEIISKDIERNDDKLKLKQIEDDLAKNQDKNKDKDIDDNELNQLNNDETDSKIDYDNKLRQSQSSTPVKNQRADSPVQSQVNITAAAKAKTTGKTKGPDSASNVQPNTPIQGAAKSGKKLTAEQKIAQAALLAQQQEEELAQAQIRQAENKKRKEEEMILRREKERLNRESILESNTLSEMLNSQWRSETQQTLTQVALKKLSSDNSSASSLSQNVGIQRRKSVLTNAPPVSLAQLNQSSSTCQSSSFGITEWFDSQLNADVKTNTAGVVTVVSRIQAVGINENSQNVVQFQTTTTPLIQQQQKLQQEQQKLQQRKSVFYPQQDKEHLQQQKLNISPQIDQLNTSTTTQNQVKDPSFILSLFPDGTRILSEPVPSIDPLAIIQGMNQSSALFSQSTPLQQQLQSFQQQQQLSNYLLNTTQQSITNTTSTPQTAQSNISGKDKIPKFFSGEHSAFCVSKLKNHNAEKLTGREQRARMRALVQLYQQAQSHTTTVECAKYARVVTSASVISRPTAWTKPNTGGLLINAPQNQQLGNLAQSTSGSAFNIVQSSAQQQQQITTPDLPLNVPPQIKTIASMVTRVELPNGVILNWTFDIDGPFMIMKTKEGCEVEFGANYIQFDTYYASLALKGKNEND